MLHGPIADPRGVLRGEELGPGHFGGRSLAAVDGRRGFGDEQLRRAQAHVHLGEVEAQTLERRERPAELLPGREVRARFLERPACEAVRGGGDGRSETAERRERDLETLTFLAEQMIGLHLDRVQVDVSDRVRRHHFEARDLEAARGSRHVEHREALRLAGLPRRPREHGVEVGDASVRDERLAPVENPAALALLRARRDVAEARTGAGLREREGRNLATARDERKNLAPERVLARERDRVRAETLEHEDDVEHARVPGQLLAHRAQRAHADLGLQGEGARLRAAVALGDGPFREPDSGERGEGRARRGVLAELLEARRDFRADVARQRRERLQGRLRSRARHRFGLPVGGVESAVFFVKSAGRFSTNARCASW